MITIFDVPPGDAEGELTGALWERAGITAVDHMIYLQNYEGLKPHVAAAAALYERAAVDQIDLRGIRIKSLTPEQGAIACYMALYPHDWLGFMRATFSRFRTD